MDVAVSKRIMQGVQNDCFDYAVTRDDKLETFVIGFDFEGPLIVGVVAGVVRNVFKVVLAECTRRNYSRFCDVYLCAKAVTLNRVCGHAGRVSNDIGMILESRAKVSFRGSVDGRPSVGRCWHTHI